MARLEYLLLDNCKNLNAYSAIQVVKLSSKLKMLSLNGLALSPDNVQVIAHLELSTLFSIGLTGAVLSVESAEIFFQNHSIFIQFSPEIQFEKPKPNLTPGELQALKKLSRDKTIILKNEDKGTTSVMMSKESKINEGLALLNEKNNYQPLTQPMVETTTRKVTQLIKSLLQEGHIDDMTAKWLSLTPNPPRIPIFYTLTKIHKPTPVGRPIISGCDGPTERISAFVDRLIQPIAQKQDSYLKDTTDFLNFIERTKLLKNTVLVSMDVTSLYTNIPHEEGVTTVCHAYPPST